MHYKRQLATLLLALPACAFAGGTATLVSTSRGIHAGGGTVGKGDNTINIGWRDAHTLRMQSQNASGYFLVRDGKAYSVSKEGGHTRVMDMAAMMEMMHSMAGKSKKSRSHFGHIDSIKASGQTETIAGIKGRVYHMTWTEADGRKKSGEAVLTDNPLVVEMTQAYMASMAAMFATEKQTNTFMSGLPGNAHGLLRVGDSLRLEAISDKMPSASRFELPAKPMDMSRMLQGMGSH